MWQIGRVLGFLAEDIHGSGDAAEAVLDRFDVYQRHNARTAGPLDDDFLIAHPLPSRKHFGHWAFRMRDQSALQAVKAIGAAETNRGIADLRRTTPQLRGGAVVADDKAILIADIDADRQQIQQAIGKVQHTLVKQDRQWNCGLHLVDEARHGHTPVRGYPYSKRARRGPSPPTRRCSSSG